MRCKSTGEYPCRSMISIKLQSNFSMGSPVNLLHIFRTPLYKNTWGELLLNIIKKDFSQQLFKDDLVATLLVVKD